MLKIIKNDNLFFMKTQLKIFIKYLEFFQNYLTNIQERGIDNELLN